MASVESIFEALGGPAAVARAIGVTTEHAASMKRRRSIPVRYWTDLLRAGTANSPPTVTNQDLIDAHTAPKVRTAMAEART